MVERAYGACTVRPGIWMGALLLAVSAVGCATPQGPHKPETAPASLEQVEPAAEPEVEPTPAHTPEFTCSRLSTFAPVTLSAQAYRERHGVGVTRVAEVDSSKEQPIEVCMVEGQLEWLVGLQCADGSSPFSSPQDAHAARSGNVGAGGRCDSIIDRYIVPCPEGDVEVFMDLYMCPDAGGS